MIPVVTAAEMRALDRAAIDEIGLPSVTLMETAGRAVAEAALRMLGERRGHVVIVCGSGNNGGDGFVAARVLRDRGIDAVVYLAVARDAVRGDARAHLAILERAGGTVLPLDAPAALAALGPRVPEAALVIDALFGTGLVRPIEGHLAAVVAMMRRAARVLAVDIPSGLHADTGRELGAAVVAERTVTMALPKIALVSSPGFAYAGEVEIAEIGIPRSLIAAANAGTSLVEVGDVAQWLPRARSTEHKGRRGHVLVVGGSPGMRGAGRLAAIAALRAGCGLCTLAADGEAGGEIAAPDPVMTRSVPAGGELVPILAGKTAVVIGPGLGTTPAARARVAEVLASGTPAVLDADALNVLAADPVVLGAAESQAQGTASPAGQGDSLGGSLGHATGPVVITPHPGEASRLLGISVAQVEADRISAARALAATTRAVVVLKGARTIVCDGTSDGMHCSINPTGGPALATGGSGDVLAGTIAALLAQGLSAVDAARAGVYVHGAAGDRLTEVHGARGVVSSDLPAAIASAIRALASGR